MCLTVLSRLLLFSGRGASVAAGCNKLAYVLYLISVTNVHVLCSLFFYYYEKSYTRYIKGLHSTQWYKTNTK